MQWENLMDRLKSGEIVPVIGNDLILVKKNNKDFISLYEYFARETAKYYEIPNPSLSIHELTLNHQGFKNENIHLKIKEIYDKLKSEKKIFIEPLIKLAEITDFKYYISTSIDDLLEDAIRNERQIAEGELNVIDYSLVKKANKHEQHNVTIFRLMGSLNNLADFAIDEEKMLEHVYSISSREYHDHPQVNELIDRIKDKIFLFIGCDFPDWFMRFLMRILTNRRLNNMVIKDYVINKSSKNPEKLVNFLTHCGKDCVVIEESDINDATTFVDQLYSQWKASARMSRKNQIKGTVFLSYYHENQQYAEYLKEKLAAEGIQVWFDKNNLGPGKHKDIIEKAIMKECGVFVPLISAEILDKPNCYAREVEWKAAEYRFNVDKYRGVPFIIIPCVIGDYDFSKNRIPDFFKELTAYNLRKEEKRLIDVIKDNLKEIIME